MAGSKRKKKRAMSVSSLGNNPKKRKIDPEASAADQLKHVINTFIADRKRHEANEQWTNACTLQLTAIKCFGSFDTKHDWQSDLERIQQEISMISSIVTF